jgi:hypothetical protein
MQRYMTNQPLDEFTPAHIQTPFTPKLIYIYSLESAEGINPVATLPSRSFTNSVVRKRTILHHYVTASSHSLICSSSASTEKALCLLV